jgi:RNA polymerase sigma-70 factor (ECF subfamily)
MAVLVARHEPRVRALCRQLVAPAEVDDAVQEVHLRVITRLAGYRGDSAFTTWLHRLTCNACHDVLRQRRRRSGRDVPLDDGDARTHEEAGGADPAEVVGCRLADADMLAALAGMPDGQRRLLVLRDLLDLSYEEIAAETGRPLGTVKCYLHRARAALGQRLAA